LASSKGSLSSHAEDESFDAVVIPVKIRTTTNLEEQMASMNATLDRLSKEGAEKDA